MQSIHRAPAHLVAMSFLPVVTPALAQTPPPPAPVAVYWMSAETAAGLATGLPSGLAGVLPSAMQGGKRLLLELGSAQASRGAPQATHAMPPEALLGEKLPLTTPRAQPAVPDGPAAREPAQQGERPKGRMLVYSGCGDVVRPGQPVVIDFSQMDAAGAASALRGVNVSRPQPPAPGRSRTYGTWPNSDSQARPTEKSSLRGLHVVSGNYTPDIQFSIAEKHDFMEPIEFSPMKRSEQGGVMVNWKAVPNTLGYLATATGQGLKGDDVVMWSSSETAGAVQGLLDYVPPPEVERLVKEKVVLPPSTNSCIVPPGIFRPGAAMLNFIAYGEELNLLHPPRPKDPKEKWQPQWSVKVRLKSTATALLGETGGDRPATGQAPAEGAPQSRGNALDQGINVIRGIFGR